MEHNREAFLVLCLRQVDPEADLGLLKCSENILNNKLGFMYVFEIFGHIIFSEFNSKLSYFSISPKLIWSQFCVILVIDSGYCLNRAFLICLRVGLGSPQWVRSAVLRPLMWWPNSPCSWSLLWSLNSHSGCVVLLFWFLLRDQSH